MQQAFKTMMGQMDTQNNQSGFSSGSPFPFPTTAAPGSSSAFPFAPPAAQGSSTGSPFSYSPPAAPSSTSSSGPASRRTVTVDVPPTKTEAPPAPTVSKDVKSVKEPKKSGM